MKAKAIAKEYGFDPDRFQSFVWRQSEIPTKGFSGDSIDDADIPKMVELYKKTEGEVHRIEEIKEKDLQSALPRIKYTSIINSFVSVEGVGAYTNYVYYSVLIVFDDGTAKIVEGNSDTIAPLLVYLRTPVDEMKEIKQIIAHLSSDINTIKGVLDEKIK